MKIFLKIKNLFIPEKRGDIYCNECDHFKEIRVVTFLDVESITFCNHPNNNIKEIFDDFYGKKTEHKHAKSCYELNKHHDCSWFIIKGTSFRKTLKQYKKILSKKDARILFSDFSDTSE